MAKCEICNREYQVDLLAPLVYGDKAYNLVDAVCALNVLRAFFCKDNLMFKNLLTMSRLRNTLIINEKQYKVKNGGLR